MCAIIKLDILIRAQRGIGVCGLCITFDTFDAQKGIVCIDG
jgi:hypothetical protein